MRREDAACANAALPFGVDSSQVSRAASATPVAMRAHRRCVHQRSTGASPAGSRFHDLVGVVGLMRPAFSVVIGVD